MAGVVFTQLSFVFLMNSAALSKGKLTANKKKILFDLR